VGKDSLVIAAVGDLDEVNCQLGLALTEDLHEATGQLLKKVQSCLFDAGAEASSLGTLPGHYADLVSVLVQETDKMMVELPPMQNFILPGGCRASAQLHACRAVCRRAERTLVALSQHYRLTKEMLAFVNRLSDWLFAAARWENHRRSLADVPWVKAQHSE